MSGIAESILQLKAAATTQGRAPTTVTMHPVVAAALIKNVDADVRLSPVEGGKIELFIMGLRIVQRDDCPPEQIYVQ